MKFRAVRDLNRSETRIFSPLSSLATTNHGLCLSSSQLFAMRSDTTPCWRSLAVSLILSWRDDHVLLVTATQQSSASSARPCLNLLRNPVACFTTQTPHLRASALLISAWRRKLINNNNYLTVSFPPWHRPCSHPQLLFCSLTHLLELWKWKKQPGYAEEQAVLRLW